MDAGVTRSLSGPPARWLVLACAFLNGCAGAPLFSPEGRGEAPPGAQDSAFHGPNRAAFDRALSLARSKFAVTECQAILRDFSDGRSRSLEQALQATGLRPSDLFERVSFADGAGLPPCWSSNVMAWTRPGKGRVYLCPDRFAAVERASPDFAANILIHEALHTLGLEENPPASAVITAAVARRCGAGPPAGR